MTSRSNVRRSSARTIGAAICMALLSTFLLPGCATKQGPQGGVAGGDVPVRTMMCDQANRLVVVVLEFPAPPSGQRVKVVANGVSTISTVSGGQEWSSPIYISNWPPSYAVSLTADGQNYGPFAYGCAPMESASLRSRSGIAPVESRTPDSLKGAPGDSPDEPPGDSEGDVPVRTFVCGDAAFTIVLEHPNTVRAQRVRIQYTDGTRQIATVPMGQTSITVRREHPGDATAVSLSESNTPVGSPVPCGSKS